MGTVPVGHDGPRPGDRRPSPPWYGGLIPAANFLGAAWLLIYTLLPVPRIQSWGAWNYIAVVALIPLQAVVVKRWRGDAYRRPEPGPSRLTERRDS
jgi:Cell division protein CrgA